MEIKIEHLNMNDLFTDLNLKIKEKSFTTILGSSSSGKTTLAKLLCGYIKNDCVKTEKAENISVIFDQIDDNFIYDTVIENLAFPLENRNISKSDMEKKISKIADYLNIHDLLECNIYTLSGGEKELIALAEALITDPKLLILDEAFGMIDAIQKQKCFKLLKKINREKKTTIVYLTSDTENVIYGKELAILANRRIIKQGSIKELLTDEKSFKMANQKLPFMADLSLKLKYYNLIDELILEESKMVDALWK